MTLFGPHVTVRVTLPAASWRHPPTAEDPVELPITIVVEPPSLVALRALLRGRWIWVVAAAILAAAGGALVLVVTVTRAEARATSTSLDLHIASRPSDAELSIDGHAAGRTPATLPVTPGMHSVSLKAADAVDVGYAVEVQAPGAALDAVLWRRQPLLAQLKPPLPGADLAGARLQPDGSVALAVDLGAEDELQAWRLDPVSDAQETLSGGLAAARLAVSPAADRVATIGREIGPVISPVPEQRRVVWLSNT
ncbi:MAG TPA: PEGA domain-containing protein, partial [Chloroflexota bacterium]|nr:PEGA domain-containing protein [Chloroflexota bacterium]